MLYPQISIEEWKRKYPSLTTPSKKCCGIKITASIPFITQDFVGFRSPVCPQCGHRPVLSMIPRGKDAIDFFDEFYDSMDT